jgi:hypothetical protein
MFKVPLFCPGLVPVTGPFPDPPVAASGVHCDTWNVILVPTVVCDAFLHCAPVTAPAGRASGTAINDAVAAAMANARAPTETLIDYPLLWTAGNE